MQIVPEGLADLFKSVWRERAGYGVYSINRGWCYQFALVLKRLHGDRVKLFTTIGHAWIGIDGVFYDSDTPQGTTDSLDRYRTEFKELSEKDFEEFWWNGGSGPMRYDIIEEVVNKWTRANQKVA